jgi:tRNA modification GTPase
MTGNPANMLEDTIIAISTPPGMGGLGIVRLSGKRALIIAKSIFRAKTRAERDFPVRRSILGGIYDRSGGEILDEAVLTFFQAPHSYTREDVVELSCHGSPVILEEIVRLGVAAGARPAHSGEFTLRAYVNGRLDILQAEAVNDLIRSTSLVQAGISMRQLSGSLSRRVLRIREKIVGIAARLEAAIEFPDEGLGLAASGHARALAPVISDLERLVGSYRVGRALREGVTVAITGRTNVGKSTLFNALLEEDRAIVTPYPGTTRDYLKEEIVIDDFVFHLVDMAGLGRPSHPVEKKGILKGQKIAEQADGLLVVLDGSRPESPEDGRLVRRFRAKKKILVVNKADLPARIDKDRLRAAAGKTPVVEISALRGTNMTGLKEEIRRTFAPSEESLDEVILHSRQRDLLREALTALRKARRLLGEGRPEEVVAEELREAASLIGHLTGEIRADEVIEAVFSRFCVGK